MSLIWKQHCKIQCLSQNWHNTVYFGPQTVKNRTILGWLWAPNNRNNKFVRMDPINVSAKFEVRSFTRSWNNRGYLKTSGSPWLRPRYFFSKIFNGRLFGRTFWMCRPKLKSVALPVPEIIVDIWKKLWAVPGYAVQGHPRSWFWYQSKAHIWLYISP